MGGCFGLAALSLLLPSHPSYDPWAWLQWGREIASLELDTSSGPSWKPLPVLFTLFFAPLGQLGDGIPPALWLVVARTGGLLALVLAFRVAWRLAGPDRRVGAAAGLVAAVALLLSPSWLRYLAHGNEAPMAVAFMLAAVNHHLDRRPRGTLVLGFLACLLRPEVFPFLSAYAVYVWRAEPDARRLVQGLALGLPVLWLVPEWIGSGDPLGAARQASSEPAWSLSLRDRPWLALLERWHGMAGVPLQAGALLGMAFALRRRERAALTLGMVAIAWLALIAAMTQLGFSGNSRYLLAPLVIASLLAGCGAARGVAAVAEGAARLLPARAQVSPGVARPVSAALTAALVALGVAPFLDRRFDGFGDQVAAVAPLAQLHGQLAGAVERAGGPEVVIAYGAPTINRKFDTHLAWELKLPISAVEAGRGEGVIFKAAGRLSGAPPRLPRTRHEMRPLARVGGWRVERARNTAPPGARAALREAAAPD